MYTSTTVTIDPASQALALGLPPNVRKSISRARYSDVPRILRLIQSRSGDGCFAPLPV